MSDFDEGYTCGYESAESDYKDTIKRLESDLALLRPVCSVSSGGLVDGYMCPKCRGTGIVKKDPEQANEQGSEQ